MKNGIIFWVHDHAWTEVFLPLVSCFASLGLRTKYIKLEHIVLRSLQIALQRWRMYIYYIWLYHCSLVGLRIRAVWYLVNMLLSLAGPKFRKFSLLLFVLLSLVCHSVSAQEFHFSSGLYPTVSQWTDHLGIDHMGFGIPMVDALCIRKWHTVEVANVCIWAFVLRLLQADLRHSLCISMILEFKENSKFVWSWMMLAWLKICLLVGIQQLVVNTCKI